MKQIEYNSYNDSSKNASSKAKRDVSEILQNCGYLKLYTPSKRRIFRILQQVWAMFNIPKDSILFIQYPSHKSIFYNIISLYKRVKKIALIHDVESLRGRMDVKEESNVLNNFDILISHNKFMTNYLRENGIIRPIVEIKIFDYLLNTQDCINPSFEKFSVFFAGNLAKSSFLQKLNQLKGVHFNIYGSSFDEIEKIKTQNNVTYKGAFSPEELIPNIIGGWGLVWDGDCLDTCSGLSGEYLKYNNPHKVSMCIMTERPIIIWKEAAMSKYVESKGIGICVNNLYELYEKINDINDIEYKVMQNNIKKEKERLLSGQNLIDCIKECNRILNIH